MELKTNLWEIKSTRDLPLHPHNCFGDQINMFFVVDFISNPYRSRIIMITYRLLQIMCSARSGRWIIDIREIFRYRGDTSAAVTPQHIVYRLYQILDLLNGIRKIYSIVIKVIRKKARNEENEAIIVFHVYTQVFGIRFDWIKVKGEKELINERFSEESIRHFVSFCRKILTNPLSLKIVYFYTIIEYFVMGPQL